MVNVGSGLRISQTSDENNITDGQCRVDVTLVNSQATALGAAEHLASAADVLTASNAVNQLLLFMTFEL